MGPQLGVYTSYGSINAGLAVLEVHDFHCFYLMVVAACTARILYPNVVLLVQKEGTLRFNILFGLDMDESRYAQARVSDRHANV